MFLSKNGFQLCESKVDIACMMLLTHAPMHWIHWMGDLGRNSLVFTTETAEPSGKKINTWYTHGTVDGRNPAPPAMRKIHENPVNNRDILPSNWCGISSINSISMIFNVFLWSVCGESLFTMVTSGFWDWNMIQSGTVNRPRLMPFIILGWRVMDAGAFATIRYDRR